MNDDALACTEEKTDLTSSADPSTAASGGSAPALRQGDRRMSSFLSRLAHELRNPLAPIQMALQIMQMSEDDLATTRAARVIVDRQLRHLTRFIDDLTDISQIAEGRIQLRREIRSLNDLLQTALQIARPQLEGKQHSLSVQIATDPMWISADPHRLSQAFANLLSNASKYSASGSDIRVAAYRDGTDAVIEISDHGIGIPQDMLERIFEPFVQVDHSTGGTGTTEGLGIGLTLVRNVVDLHGGSVRAQSAGLAQGSRFVIRLPTQVAGTNSETGVPAPTDTSDARRLRILIADDNRDTAQTLAIMLRFEGHDVRTVRDGVEALAMGEVFQPELVFLDIGMPVLDGYQTARRTRERAWGQQAHLIALTGWGQDADREKAVAAGFEDHIVKPAEPERLRAVIDRARTARRS